MGIPIDRRIGSPGPRPTHSSKPSWSESPSEPIDYPLTRANTASLTSPPRVRHQQDYSNLPLSALAYVPPTSTRGSSTRALSSVAPTLPSSSQHEISPVTGSLSRERRGADAGSTVSPRPVRPDPSLRRLTRSPVFVLSPSSTTSRAGNSATERSPGVRPGARTEAETGAAVEPNTNSGTEPRPASNQWPSQWRSASVAETVRRENSSTLSAEFSVEENGTSWNYRLVNTSHADNQDRVDIPGQEQQAQRRRLQRNPPYTGAINSANSSEMTTVQPRPRERERERERDHERETRIPSSSTILSPLTSMTAPSPNPLPPFLQGLPTTCRTVVRTHPVYQRVIQIFPENHEPIYMYGRPAPTTAASSSTSYTSMMTGGGHGVVNNIPSANVTSS